MFLSELVDLISDCVAKAKAVKHDEELRVDQMNEFLCEYPDRSKLHQSAQKIQKVLYGKIKRRRMAREMRKKMATLPYVVRAGFVKMEYLKIDAKQV